MIKCFNKTNKWNTIIQQITNEVIANHKSTNTYLKVNQSKIIPIFKKVSQIFISLNYTNLCFLHTKHESYFLFKSLCCKDVIAKEYSIFDT